MGAMQQFKGKKTIPKKEKKKSKKPEKSKNGKKGRHVNYV